jgi:transketolase
MFILKDFIKKGLFDAVGNMADYQVRLNAAGWHEKGVLDESDLAEIEAKIEAKNNTNRLNSMDDLNAEEA